MPSIVTKKINFLRFKIVTPQTSIDGPSSRTSPNTAGLGEALAIALTRTCFNRCLCSNLVSSNVMNQVMGPSVVAIHRAQVSFDKVPLIVGVPGYILILNRGKCIMQGSCYSGWASLCSKLLFQTDRKGHIFNSALGSISWKLRSSIVPNFLTIFSGEDHEPPK